MHGSGRRTLMGCSPSTTPGSSDLPAVSDPLPIIRFVPTYEYACLSCGTHVEVYQRFADPPLTACGVCGGPLRKVFHPAGILFKGSGFYVTDSRGGKRSAAAAGGSDGGKEKSKEPAKNESASKASTSEGTSSSGSGSGSGSSS